MWTSTHAPKWINWKYLVSVLILLLGFAGCSPASEEKTNTPSESISDLDESASDIVTEDQDVVISFSYERSLHAIIEPLIEAFNKENPSITVMYVPLLEDDINKNPAIEAKLLMLASSADTTLTSIRSPYTGSYFLDLQPLIDSDATFDQADFWNGTLSVMEDTEGRITGLPMTLFLQGVFYDTSAFDAANLPYPQPGWNWDDFRSAAAILAQNERYGFGDRGYTSILRPLIGYDLALNDGKINASVLASNLDWYLQMANEDQILAMRSSDDLLRAQFTSGTPPAMWAGSLFDLALGLVTGDPEATNLSDMFADSAYSYAPFPVDTHGEQMNTTPIAALYGAISRGSEHPLAAWKWLNFLSEHWLVSNTSDALNQLHIPARQSVAQSIGYWDYYPPEVQDAMQYGLEHAWFASLYPQAENEVLDTIKQVAVLNSSLKSSLEDVEAQQTSWPQEISDVPQISIAAPPQQDRSALGADTIRFYHNNYDQKGEAAIIALVNQFNKDHQGEISVQQSNVWPQSPGTYYEVFTDNYDCFLSQLDPLSAPYSGNILDLTALLEAEDIAFQQDFDPLFLDAARPNGALYALPISSQPPIIVYNADLLAERGLEPPSLDWTFDDFLEIITAVTSASQEEPVYGFLPSSHLVSTTEMFYAGRGVQWRDIVDDFPVVMLDTPEMASAIAWMNELEQSGIVFQSAPDNNWYYAIENAMDSGHLGFWTADAGLQELDFSGIAPLKINIGIAPLPYTDKPNGSFSRSYDIGFYIAKETEYPEACWELAKYISEGIEVLQGVPARISVANSAAWEAYVGAENAEIYRAAVANNLTNAEIDQYEGWFWSPINQWKGQAITNINNGNNASQELAQAQQFSDAYLACMVSHDVLSMNYDKLKLAAQSCAVQVDPNWE